MFNKHCLNTSPRNPRFISHIIVYMMYTSVDPLAPRVVPTVESSDRHPVRPSNLLKFYLMMFERCSISVPADNRPMYFLRDKQRKSLCNRTTRSSVLTRRSSILISKISKFQEPTTSNQFNAQPKRSKPSVEVF